MKPFIFISLVCLCFSCKKKKFIKDYVYFGDTENMEIVNLKADWPASPNPNQPIYQFLDVDRDGNSDFCLIVYVLGFSNSTGKQSSYGYRISSLSKNALVMGTLTNDTTFYSASSTISTIDSKINKFKTIREFCPRQSASDSIKAIYPNNLKVISANLNDLLDPENNFQVGQFELKDKFDYGAIINLPSKDDTVRTERKIINESCNSFAFNKRVYIGIKILNKSGEKYGWINLILLNYGEIIAYQTAIQR